jgi:dTDP-4-dehydrorhamnose 3,5-epimerase
MQRIPEEREHMPFSFRRLSIDGLMLIEPRSFPDARGSFMETYRHSDFVREGIADHFLQDNHSVSQRNVLRGLHFQRPPHSQGKLIRIIAGRAWDVAVDLRPGSPTYGLWEAIELSAENRLIFWIPEGFAHGFLALEDDTVLLYRCTAEYAPDADAGILWSDPDLAIAWPCAEPIISDKDASLPTLARLGEAFPAGGGLR